MMPSSLDKPEKNHHESSPVTFFQNYGASEKLKTDLFFPAGQMFSWLKSDGAIKTINSICKVCLMNAIRIAAIVLFLLVLTATFQVAAELPPRETLRQWVEEMKTNSRGPFARIRWFCNDGSILPPKPYACRDHDGGVQHGEWSDRVKRLRAGGYYIGNVLAALDIDQVTGAPGYSDLYNQILIEKFLIAAGDGWMDLS